MVQSEVVVFRLEAGLLKTHWHSSTKAAFLNWWFVTQKLVSLFEKGFLEKILFIHFSGLNVGLCDFITRNKVMMVLRLHHQ